MHRSKTRPRRSSPLRLTSAFELFSKSAALVKKNIWIFGPLYGVYLLFGLHSWIWSPASAETGHHWWNNNFVSTPSGPGPIFVDYSFVGFSITWLLVTIVVGTIVQIMTQTAQLEAAQAKTPTFDKLWAITKELGLRLFGLYIIASLIILLGLIFFIIPGLFMVKRYFLSPYVMIDQKVGIREALDRSAAISTSFGAIWGVVLVIILFGLISIVPMIGWLVSFILGMLYSVAPALRYEELKRISE